MAQDSPRYTIAIIGAGIAGPVVALTILSHPTLSRIYKPIVYERLPNPTPPSPANTNQPQNYTTGEVEEHAKATYAAGAAVALTSNALFPLYQLGLREEVDAISCETKRIKIWRAYGGKERSHKYFNQITHPNWQEDLGTCLRVVERGDLQRLVLERVRENGGEVRWGKKLVGLESVAGGVEVRFEDGEEVKVDLVVGADGGWSSVRRFICDANGKAKGAENWRPYFSAADGIYGVSKPIEKHTTGEGEAEETAGDTHWVLLDSGTASTWELPGGRQFWTISFPSKKPPERNSQNHKPKEAKLYGADVTLGGHSFEETAAFLKKSEDAWHPVAGSFGELFRRSERIVRAPLWYRAWEEDEISGANVVLIGDASRLMLPSSGQGACFAIEDATILANALLNNTPTSESGVLDFSKAIKEYTEIRVPRSKSMTRQSYYTALLGMSDRWWWRWVKDFATAWIPMGGDPKANTGKKPNDPMGWLYESRFKVALRDD